MLPLIILTTQGIQFGIEEGYLEDSPEAIAEFLLDVKGLDPAQIGEVLGERWAWPVSFFRPS